MTSYENQEYACLFSSRRENKLFRKIQMIIVLSIYVLCANASSKHEEYILETIPEWARFSQGSPKKKAKKHVTSTQKIGPAKERKEGQEKRKKRGGDKAKTKSQYCCVVKVFCTKTLFGKNGGKI